PLSHTRRGSRVQPALRNHDDGTSWWSGSVATWLMAAAGHRVARKPGTGHAGTISVTARGAPRPQNAMKPRFQCALTPWKPGFMASGTRASSHDHHKLTGNARFRACATPDPRTYGYVGTGSGPRRWDIVVVVPAGPLAVNEAEVAMTRYPWRRIRHNNS